MSRQRLKKKGLFSALWCLRPALAKYREIQSKLIQLYFCCYSKDMLNRVHTSLQNFQRPNSATLPASWKKKSASSYQSPSTETSSTEQSPDGSVSSLVGAQHTSFDSAVMTHSSRESTLDRNRRRSSGEVVFSVC